MIKKTYRKIDKDPTNKFERIGNSIVKMMERKLIDEPRAKRLTSKYSCSTDLRLEENT